MAVKLTGIKKATCQSDRPVLGDDFKYQSKATLISEFGIYKAILNSHKPEAEEFEEWIFTILKNLRQSANLEGFQAFRMTDKEIQKEVMKLFEPKEKKDFMIINRMANVIVSKKFGYEKAIKKDDMTQEMLNERQKVLQALVSISNMTGSKGEANKIVKQLMTE